jgi:TIR domain
MMARVFISYRRNDSKYQARMIYGAFQNVLPRGCLFMDIDSIPPGVDFVETLKSWVHQCEIMLALIGPGWIDATDPKTGRRRLDDPNDFVRVEIREGLARGVPIVPVLLDDAPMPDTEHLPEDMKALVRRQAEFVAYRTFDTDVKRLIKGLGLGGGEVFPARSAGSSRRQPEQDRRPRVETASGYPTASAEPVAGNETDRTLATGSVMNRLWDFICQERNRVMLGWLGGGLVVTATGIWAAFVYFFPPQKPAEPRPANVQANCGGVAVGGNVTGTTITAGTPTNSDCSTKPK